MRLFLLLLLIAAICPAIHSQEKFVSVTGIVSDSASAEPLEKASVSLLRSRDRSMVKQLLSGRSGFQFNRISPGEYLLAVSFVNYYPDTLRIAVTAKDSVYNIGNIKLSVAAANLMEVVVRSVIPPVIVKNDTIIYNTNTVATEPNATIEDLLKKLPGMEVDKNGNITLNGQKVEKVYIDGKEFFLDDPRLATQNLTADMVDAIEAFDHQSDKARYTGIKDMNANKAINLRLKKDKKKGIFGNATAGAGTLHNYSGNATATYFKGSRWLFATLTGNHMALPSSAAGLQQSSASQALNYRDEPGSKIKLVAGYRHGSNNNQAGQLYRRETFLGDSSLLQNRSAQNKSHSDNHNANLSFTYDIDSLSSIVYTPSLSWQQSHGTSADTSFILAEKTTGSYIVNEGRTANDISSNGAGINNALAYRRRFNKKGRSLYIHLSQNQQRQNSDGSLFSSVKFYDNTGALSENKTVDQQYRQENNNDNYGLDISYTEPLKDRRFIDIGYRINRSSGISARQAFNYNPLTGGYDTEDTLTTNRATNSNTQQNFNLGYNFIGEKTQLQLGMSLLSTSLENENSDQKYASIRQHNLNWSPRASFFYRFAKQKNLRLQYNGSSTAPSTEMLQPIPDLSNPFLVKTGNPDLKQQFRHQLNISYNKSDSKKFTNLSLQAGGDYTQNKIVQSSVISSAGIQQLMYVNVNGIYAVNGRLNYGFALSKSKKGGGAVAAWLGYNRNINLVNGEQNIRRSFLAGGQANLNYHIEDKLFTNLSATLSYNRSRYSIGKNLNTEFFSQNYTAGTTWLLPWDIHISSDLTLQVNGKQGSLPGRTISTWNAAMYKNMLHNKGEIRFSCFDLLNGNKGFSQSAGDNYIETRESAVFRRYFVLSLRYNFFIKTG